MRLDPPVATSAVPASSEAPPVSTAPEQAQPDDDPVDGGDRGDPTGVGVGDALFPNAGNPGIDVEHYDVVLSYDPGSDDVTGTVEIDLTTTDARDEITLDIGDDLTVASIELDGSPIEFASEPPELHLQLGRTVVAGERLRLRVSYAGDPNPTSAPYGLDAGWVDTPGGSFVLNEPVAARTWLPCNDHPSDKATWSFSITVPAGMTAVANGALTEHRTTEGGELWVWEQDEPMATYLVQLLTGDYELVEQPAVDGVEIVHAVLADDRDRMQQYFDLTDDMIRFFEPLFGPYPLDRYGIAITDSFPGLAMETQGRSMFSRDDFLFDDGYVTELLLSHELAHQWFGNAVTPARWRDIWLNESFATYGQWLWLAGGDPAALEGMAEAALEQRSFIDAATGDPTAANMFDFAVYDGGAVVLHALRKVVGDDAFFAILQTWVADNTGTSRTTGDFIAHVERSSPGFPASFWNEWLYARDLPGTYPG